MSKKVHLQQPPGFAGIFLREASWHQEIVDITQELYKSWGYTIVRPPMVDFFDAHSHLFTEVEAERIYRLIGRDGEVLMLRSDITVFLLRHYQNFLKEARLPLRLAYSDSILRHEQNIDISRNEHYQTGVELIGEPDKKNEHDLEVLFLLSENLQALKLQSPAIHIGSRNLLDLALPEGTRDRLAAREAVFLRDWQGLRAELSGLSTEQKEETVRFFSSIWEIDDSEPVDFGKSLPEAVHSEIEAIRKMLLMLTRYFPDFSFRIDPSETGSRNYYCGLTFQVYLENLPYAIASGGRYDQLFREMGLNGAAVGYSIMLSALPPDETRPLPVARPLEGSEGSFETRYERARAIRRKGGRVCL